MAARRVLADGAWMVRADDRLETVRHRLDGLPRADRSLMDFYVADGILRRVDADGGVDTVATRVLAALDRDGPTSTQPWVR